MRHKHGDTVHLWRLDNERYQCGKRPVWNTRDTSELRDVTCKVCRHTFLYNKGSISEYKLGGSFDKDGKPRARVNQWSKGSKDE